MFQKLLTPFYWFSLSVCCITIGGNAIAFAFIEPSGELQAKLFAAGIILPGHVVLGGLTLLLVPVQLPQRIRQKRPTRHEVAGLYNL